MSTTVAALAIALAVYAVFTGVIFHRIGTRLAPSGSLHDPTTCNVCRASDPPGVPVGGGARVPTSCIVAAAVTAMLMPLVAEIMTRLRRHRRFLNDECVECGRPITSWRGRCRGCGVRIGPG